MQRQLAVTQPGEKNLNWGEMYVSYLEWLALKPTGNVTLPAWRATEAVSEPAGRRCLPAPPGASPPQAADPRPPRISPPHLHLMPAHAPPLMPAQAGRWSSIPELRKIWLEPEEEYAAMIAAAEARSAAVRAARRAQRAAGGPAGAAAAEALGGMRGHTAL